MTTTPATYLYAITADDAALPHDLAGLGDARVGVVCHDGLCAVVGPVDAERPVGRRADVLAHGRVLDALVQHGGPVIPVRFGAVFEDEAQVVEAVLAPQAEQLVEVLEGLRDRSQFTLRAQYDEAVVLAEVVGENDDIAALRAATRERPEDETYPARVRLGELVGRAMEYKRESDGNVVLDALAPRAVATQVLPGAGLDHVIEAAFLVDHALVPQFEQAAEDVAASFAPRAKVALVGPVAPYDFVPKEG